MEENERIGLWIGGLLEVIDKVTQMTMSARRFDAEKP